MSADRRILLVVPCYNEAARLDGEAYSLALRQDPGLGFLFVDDGSTDATRAALDALAARHPSRVAVLALPRNGGKAEAVRLGLVHALGQGADYVGYWDADLQIPLDAVPDLAGVLDADPACQGVLSARVLLLGRRIERTLGRHLLGRAFATGASAALGLPIYDTQCGAKLFRASGLLAAVVETPFLARWAFDVELIARLCAAREPETVPGFLREFPLRECLDNVGSKVSARGAVRAWIDLWRIAWRYRLRPRGHAMRPAPATAVTLPSAVPAREGR